MSILQKMKKTIIILFIIGLLGGVPGVVSIIRFFITGVCQYGY